MLKYGIVCEFNPFHNGHKYLIEKTKEATGADAIVCAMSGSMVQRGDVAIFDKWTRAAMAVKNGADLVIELPVSYVLQSADNFAYGGISLLNSLGVDGISFGSEFSDLETLKKIAEIKNNEPQKYKDAFKKSIENGDGYPLACQKGLQSCIDNLPEEVLKPNTTLAISYICSALKINSDLKFNVVKRIGDYHSKNLCMDYPSASAIRENILNGNKAFNIYNDCDIFDINCIASLILGYFRITPAHKLNGILGMENGLANRMIKSAKISKNLEEFINNCVTKRYTAHRIRRCTLCALLGINKCEKPSYVRVLAFNSIGAKVLKDIKNNTSVKIITKPADYKYSEDSMFAKDILSTDIQALCAGKNSSLDFTNSPIVI